MEQFVERSFLFDFYGELLTEHQKRIYKEIVFDDFSVSEIARDEGISRQGVHDLMKRCDKILREYEERLHLVERFLNVRKDIIRIQELANPHPIEDEEKMPETDDAQTRMNEICRIANEILEEL